MSGETEIDDEIEAVEDLSAQADVMPTKARNTVGFKTLGIATLIAASLGAGGGTFLSKITSPAMPNLSPLKTQIETALSENKTLKFKIADLEQDLKKSAAQKSVAAPKVDLSGIEQRLDALEAIEPQTQAIDEELLTRLEALQSEGSEALDLSDILARLEKLETQKLVSQTIDEADRKALLMELKSDLMTEETLLENSDAPRSVLSASTGLPVPLSPADIPPFPKTTILDALSKADESGWIKRTLNKHITVQSEDNPRYVVELIEKDLDAGDLTAAVTKFDTLPEAAQTAAKTWRAAFKDMSFKDQTVKDQK